MFLVIALLFSYVKEFRHFRIIAGLDFNCKANNLVPGLFLLHGFQSFRSKMKLIGCKSCNVFRLHAQSSDLFLSGIHGVVG